MTPPKMRREFMGSVIKPFNPKPGRIREGGHPHPRYPSIRQGYTMAINYDDPKTLIAYLWEQFRQGNHIDPVNFRLLWKAYYKSDAWQQRRSMIFGRAKGRCEADDCEAKAEQAHHLNYVNSFNETEHDLMAMCGDCHQELERPKVLEPWRAAMLA